MIIFCLVAFAIVLIVAFIAGIISGMKQPNTSQRRQLNQIEKAKASSNSSTIYPSETKVIHQSDLATVTLTTSYSVHTVEIGQKTLGALAATPISAWDGYISPSGGFVNYGRFQVIGKNPATNRKNKRIYEVRNEEEACKCAEDVGLLGPFEVSVLSALPPTDAQIAYAQDLGATIPEGACKTDVSAIISRITGEDEEPASEHLARKAHECGLKFSRYHGQKAIMELARDLPSKAYSEILRAM